MADSGEKTYYDGFYISYLNGFDMFWHYCNETALVFVSYHKNRCWIFEWDHQENYKWKTLAQAKKYYKSLHESQWSWWSDYSRK